MPKRRQTVQDLAVAPIRDDIVEAAAAVFSAQGYHAASMQDVADRVGIRKASLYHHVRSKADLLYAIHERLIDLLIAETLAVISTDDDPPVKIRRVMRVAMHLIADHNREVRVFLRDADILEGERWNSIVAKRDLYEDMVAGVVADGVRQGAFADWQPKLATRGLLAMANWGYTWFKPGGPLTPDEVADFFSQMILKGLEKRD